nr:endonuclease/exonuclease/phosphatase family protein [Anaerolineae bacterium]
VDTRLPALQPFLDVLPALVKAGYPVLFTGDFNTPSHLDWTEAMVGKDDHIRYAVKWPVSAAIVDAGFVDTYRTIYPDPTKRTGMTWTPGYPVPRLRPNEVVDRIDMIFAGGNIKVIDSQIVGEKDGKDVDIGVAPWPSDHRAVVSTVLLTPATPPLFTSLDERIVHVGDPIVVRYAAPNGEATDHLVIVPKDGTHPKDALMSLPPAEADFYGAMTFGSARLIPGEYEALLVDGDGKEWARNNFWVIGRDAVPQIHTEKEKYSANESIVVEWENAPDNRYDWVGIYKANDSDLYNYLGFLYTQQASSGKVTFDDLKLEPGKYEARFMLDDGYVILASVSFIVGE